MYIVVQCGQASIVEDGTRISVENCVKFSVLVNQCVRPSCSLGGSTYQYLCFYNYHWADNSADGLIISEGIIHLEVDASALTWFISYSFIEMYTVPI